MSVDLPLVSIIVPVYNSEDRLKYCVDSIINQTYENIEIILVNDGSTDNSKTICEEYEENDKRIIVVNKNNGGPNSARKEGFSRSKGDFVMFVDSDDWLSCDAISDLVGLFSKNNVDIIKYCIVTEPSKNIVGKILGDKNRTKILKKEDALFVLYSSDNLNSLCSQIYRRSVINAEDFYLDISHGEDYLTNIAIYKKIDRILIVNEVYYHYFDNNKSNTKTVDLNAINRNINEINNVYDIIMSDIRAHNFSDRDKSIIYISILDRYRTKISSLFKVPTIDYVKFSESMGLIYESNPYKEILREVGYEEIKEYIHGINFIERIKRGRLLKMLYRGKTNSIWSMRLLYGILMKLKV